jgi:tRNA-splicing endonuclease subunit Sen54
VPFPTLPQMTEVFDIVPEVPKPYLRRRAPPAGTPRPEPTPASSTTATSWVPGWLKKVFGKNIMSKQDETPQVNTFLSLKQGDRTIIVAVVDGGNVGWTRLGRGGFEEHLMVPHGW